MQSKYDVIWDQNLSKLFLDIKKTNMNKKLQTVNLQITNCGWYVLYIIRYDYILIPC